MGYTLLEVGILVPIKGKQDLTNALDSIKASGAELKSWRKIKEGDDIYYLLTIEVKDEIFKPSRRRKS